MKRSMAWCFCIILLLFTISDTYASKTETSGSQESPLPSSNQGNAACIQISEKIFNFGEVLEGGEILHDFVVKNTGTEALSIEQVRPG